jgi:hypothetical protein
LRLWFPSLPEPLPGTSSREWRDECWKISQGHVQILTETAVSHRKSLRTIRTSLLCRTTLATAVLFVALVTASMRPVLAGGGNGGAGNAGAHFGGGSGGADRQPGGNATNYDYAGGGGNGGANGQSTSQINNGAPLCRECRKCDKKIEEAGM